MTAEGDVPDVPMEGIEAGSEGAARVKEGASCPETARETGIARALIASERRPQPMEEWLEQKINGRTFRLGKTLDSEAQDQIAKVISRHLDTFAWSVADMPGIDPDFLCHRLAIDPPSQANPPEEEKVQ